MDDKEEDDNRMSLMLLKDFLMRSRRRDNTGLDGIEDEDDVNADVEDDADVDDDGDEDDEAAGSKSDKCRLDCFSKSCTSLAESCLSALLFALLFVLLPLLLTDPCSSWCCVCNNRCSRSCRS